MAETNPLSLYDLQNIGRNRRSNPLPNIQKNKAIYLFVRVNGFGEMGI